MNNDNDFIGEYEKRVQLLSYSNRTLMYILIALITSILIWSIFGTINQEEKGIGIITSRHNKFFSATTKIPGIIQTVNVKIGDNIKKGQLVATLNAIEIKTKIETKQNYIDHLQKIQKHSLKLVEKDTSEVKENEKFIINELQKYNKNIEGIQKFLTTLHKAEKGLGKQGYISRVVVEKELLNLYNTRQQIFGTMVEVNKSRLSYDDFTFKKYININTQALRILEAQDELLSLEKRYLSNYSVRSNSAGRVLDINVSQGQFYPAGTIINVAISGRKFGDSVIALFNATTGKKIQTNMEALVTPDSINKFKYGSIKGHVNNISQYAITKPSLLAILHNQSLVDLLFNNNMPKLQAIINLKHTNNNKYIWTSEGPPYQITSGTICQVNVVVRKDAPITFVFPLLKRWLNNA